MVFLALSVLNEFLFQPWLEVLVNLYLVPQIIHNAIRGHFVEFDKNFLICFMCIRSLLPVIYIYRIFLILH